MPGSGEFGKKSLPGVGSLSFRLYSSSSIGLGPVAQARGGEYGQKFWPGGTQSPSLPGGGGR